MKPWHILLTTGVFLLVVQSLHVAKHDTYCKSEGEWRRSLGLTQSEYDELKWNLNN